MEREGKRDRGDLSVYNVGGAWAGPGNSCIICGVLSSCLVMKHELRDYPICFVVPT